MMSGESSGNKEQNDTKTTGLRFRGSSRLFNKRFTNTSRFVVSSKVWMNTIPTRDCDVLVTFPSNTSDQTLLWLLSRLRTRTPELSVHVRHHSNTGVFGYYLTATYENLLKAAEDLEIQKPLKLQYGGGNKEFIFDDQECFEGIEESSTFLTSQERQNIVQHMLNNLRAVEGEQLGKIRFLEGQAIAPVLLSKNIVSQVLPLHNNETLKSLQCSWVKAFFSKQPLDAICDYFGVKLALYFAYLGHYTVALTIPAFLGVVIWVFSGLDQTTDDMIFVGFALFNALWATLYLEHWKRRSSVLAYKWGTLDKEDDLLKEPRPLFKGDLQRSPVTGRLEPYYPNWKRNLFRYFITTPIICTCLGLVFLSMLAIFELQEWVNGKIAQGEYPAFLRFIPKILLAVSIGIQDDIYKRIATWLNDLENYRLDETYENHLVIKLVLFQFVNSFLSLFYIGFYLRDMDRLKEQLATLLITRQVIGNIKEALVPYIFYKLKIYKIGYDMTATMSPDTLDKQMKEMTSCRRKNSRSNSSSEDKCSESNSSVTDTSIEHTPPKDKDSDCEDEIDVKQSGPQLTQAEVESAMKKYEDTFEDFMEMFIQFGYVVLFSSAFPLAALCALLNNIIEIRSDAFKLCMNFQRPFGERVSSIGIWEDLLGIMGVIAIGVNCCLIGISGLVPRMVPQLSTTEVLVFIVILEHVILAVKLLIAYAIPDVPYWVATEKARWEFQRREALKRLAAQTTSPPPLQNKNAPNLIKNKSNDPNTNNHVSNSEGSSLGGSTPTSPITPTSKSVIVPSPTNPATSKLATSSGASGTSKMAPHGTVVTAAKTHEGSPLRPNSLSKNGSSVSPPRVTMGVPPKPPPRTSLVSTSPK
ncbi:unnamed protein product [Owenia fusiformis]|uniref:Anoctamin n=1 Tax=Owenia fusiformis TaxID=6347 RepID=A0A8S4PV99_OWEFU|nr:unnamed protein product [Owenia fusiformis]